MILWKDTNLFVINQSTLYQTIEYVKKQVVIDCFLCTFAPACRRAGLTINDSFFLMFERLKKKWKVNGLQLALILCTFAIGGSLTGFVGKKIMNVLAIQQDWQWAVVYILLVTIIWPLAVLLVSIPFGQYRFFIRYINKIGEKMGLVKKSRKSEES